MQGALIKQALLHCRLSVSVEELNWDSASSQDRLKDLSALAYDYIIAADCLYTDEARPPIACFPYTLPLLMFQLSAADLWAALF